MDGWIHQRSGMRTHTGNQEINIFFIGLSVQARWGGSFELLLTWFWPLDRPLEFFKFFFLFSDPHFRRKKKCSDSPENSTNRPDDIKSGPNLVSDRFFDFSQKKVFVLVPIFYPAQPQVAQAKANMLHAINNELTVHGHSMLPDILNDIVTRQAELTNILGALKKHQVATASISGVTARSKLASKRLEIEKELIRFGSWSQWW